MDNNKPQQKREKNIHSIHSKYKYPLIYKIFYFIHLPCLFLVGEERPFEAAEPVNIAPHVLLSFEFCWYQEIKLHYERSIFRCKHLPYVAND